MDIQLHKPEPGDIGWIVSMHGLVYSREFGFNQQFELDIAGKAALFPMDGDGFGRIFIARAGEKRVGSIALSDRPDRVAFINFVLVKESYRGMGVGQILLNRVEAHARAHAFHRLRLETYSCLKAARKLYERFGFKPVEVNASIEKYGQIVDQEFWEMEI